MSVPRLSARRVVAASALGISAVLACAGPASAAAPGPTAAASWLTGALTDGNHVVIGGFGYDGTSADTVYALAAAGGHDDTVAAVDAYLRTDVASYADPAGTGAFPGPYSGGLAKLALVAETTGADPHAYGGFDLLGVLAAKECAGPTPDGTCNAPGEFYQSFTTISQALGVLALQRSPVAGDHLAGTSAPVTRLLALRCTDGLFTGDLLAPGATCATGDVDSSAYAAQALAAVLGVDSGPFRQTLDALAGAQKPSGGFRGASGVNANSTGVALSALALRSSYAPVVAKGVAFLGGLQRADGAYAVSATDASDGTALQATPQALLGVLGQNLAGITPPTPPTTTTSPTTPTTPTTSTPASTGAAPATAAAPELAATGVSNGHLSSQLLSGLAALAAGGAALWFGVRRLPRARHRA